MSQLVAFLNARLDEDEAAATAAASGPWMAETAQTAADADHIARHDPTRVLREIAAHRAIIEFYAEPPDGVRSGNVEALSNAEDAGNLGPGVLTAIEAITLDLAAVWSDHPAYDPAWSAMVTRP